MVSCLMGDSTALASAIVRCCLKRFQADAAGSWASEAGQLYGERLDVDIEEIGNAVRTFESAKNQLRQTVRTYAGGELNTINRLNWHYYNRLSVR